MCGARASSTGSSSSTRCSCSRSCRCCRSTCATWTCRRRQAGLAVGGYSGAVAARLPDRRALERAHRRAPAHDLRRRAAVRRDACAWRRSRASRGSSACGCGQGLSSAISWTAGMAWLSEASPARERGKVLGLAMSFASVGTLVGPVVGGTLGVGVRHHGPVRPPRRGRGAPDRRLPRGAAGAACGRGGARARARQHASASSRLVLAALIVMTLVATVSGTLDTLVPLRHGPGRLLGGRDHGRPHGGGRARQRPATTASAACSTASAACAIAVISMLATAALVALPVVFAAAVVAIAVFLASTPAIAGQYAVAFPLCAAGADEAGLAALERLRHPEPARGAWASSSGRRRARRSPRRAPTGSPTRPRRAGAWRSPATAFAWHSPRKSAKTCRLTAGSRRCYHQLRHSHRAECQHL